MAASTYVNEIHSSVQQLPPLQAQTLNSVERLTIDVSRNDNVIRREALENHETLMQNLASTTSEMSELRSDVLRDESHSKFMLDLVANKISQGQQEILARMRSSEQAVMQQIIRAQSIMDPTSLLQEIRDGIRSGLQAEACLPLQGPSAIDEVAGSEFEVNITSGTVKYSCNDSSTSPLGRNHDMVAFRKAFGTWRCICRKTHSTKVWSCGPFGFKTGTRPVKHCSIHGESYSWSYSIEAKLSPWLHKVLEFTLGVNKSRQAWQILPSLKLNPVVERAKSPLFRLFDDFIDKCPTVSSDYRENTTRWWSRKARCGIFLEWDNSTTTRYMTELVCDIQQLITSGQASGSDVDEHGHTLLMVRLFISSIRNLLTKD